MKFPKVVRIEPASKCNLACRHCPTGIFEMSRGIMKLEVFEKILKEIKIHKDLIETIVLYHGGEPFLNKNFFYMLSELKKIKNFFIKTVSNAAALNEKTINKIAESELDLIEFSFDGNNKEENEFIRRKVKTEIVLKNIKLLIEKKIKLSKKNPKINICSTQFLSKNNLASHNNPPLTPSWITKNFQDDDVYFLCNYVFKFPQIKEDENIDQFEMLKVLDEDNKNFCDHVINTISIRSNGDVVPCCFDLTTELKMGNILEDSLGNIWANKEYHELRQSIINKKYKSICNNCNVVRPPIYLSPKF
jgi:radical SAM protein with 4Fe4S-binding SPASM domain